MGSFLYIHGYLNFFLFCQIDTAKTFLWLAWCYFGSSVTDGSCCSACRLEVAISVNISTNKYLIEQRNDVFSFERSFNWWRSMVRTRKLEEEAEVHMNEMRQFTMKMQQAALHYERTVLRK